MDQRHAKLRVCASCEWIFKKLESCPQCGFAHYGARFVYGNSCYKYAVTQKPWFDKRMGHYQLTLMKKIHSNKALDADAKKPAQVSLTLGS